MQASQTPTLVPLAFAANGTKNTIPENSQIGVTPGAASLNDGFPPLTFTPIAAGGVPPAGADFNGVLNLITQTIRWSHAGGMFGYNSTFAADTNVGGYPRGALLLNTSRTGLWLNATDNNASNPDTGGAGWTAAFPAGVVGQARNLAMSIPTASATATLTADEIVVETALGGQTYRLASFNRTINLATTGAGGMDAGTAPASGFVALYAIYNPTTAASALLATNATSAIQPNVYGGANMPSGYTASALVSVWPTNASSQFVAAYQAERTVWFPSALLLSSSSATGSINTLTSLSISAIVPRNANKISGFILVTNSAAGIQNVAVGSSTTGIGFQQVSLNTVGGNAGAIIGNYRDIPIIAAQTIFYGSTANAVPASYGLSASSYSF